MSATIRLLGLCLGLALLTTQSMASTRVGIYAIIDEVKLEPSDFEPALPKDSNCSLEVSVHTDWSTAVPEPYPAPGSDGVVTVFDEPDDICPRFGRPSVQIIVDLREAHSPGIVQNAPPVCVERIGLISPSSLDSAFVTQTRDPEWADPAETLILQRLAQAPGLELSDLGVECRDTICHIRLGFPTSEYQEVTGNRLAADALNELPGFAQGGKIIPPRDEPTMDYYLQRRKSPIAQTSSGK